MLCNRKYLTCVSCKPSTSGNAKLTNPEAPLAKPDYLPRFYRYLWSLTSDDDRQDDLYMFAT